MLATTRCCWPHKPTRLQAIQETGRSLAGWGSIQPWREEDSLNSVLNYLPFKVCHFDPCCELKVSIKIKHVMNTVTPEIINTAVAGLHLCSLKSSFPWLLSSSEREWDVRSLGCILGNKKREHFKQSVFTDWCFFIIYWYQSFIKEMKTSLFNKLLIKRKTCPSSSCGLQLKLKVKLCCQGHICASSTWSPPSDEEAQTHQRRRKALRLLVFQCEPGIKDGWPRSTSSYSLKVKPTLPVYTQQPCWSLGRCLWVERLC